MRLLPRNRRPEPTRDPHAEQLSKSMATAITTGLRAYTAAATAATHPRSGDTVHAGEHVRRDGTTHVAGLFAGVRSLYHRQRAALYPWGIAAAVTGVVFGAWWAGHLTGHTLLASLIATTVIGVAVIGSGMKTVPAVHAWLRPWLVAVHLVAAAWTVWAAPTGPTITTIAVAVTATGVCGLRWWQWVRHPYPVGDPLTRRVLHSDGAVTAATIAEDWILYAASPGGPVAGAQLGVPKPYQYGFSADIELVRGKQTVSDLQSRLPLIVSALDVQDDRIVVEKHPSKGAAWARVQFVTRSPIEQGVFFDQPIYRDGALTLGPYADGMGNAVFKLYSQDSMNGGYVLGGRGSGKSRLLEQIAIGAMACTPTVVIYLDGQNGASSSLLWKHAVIRGGPRDARRIVRALRRVLRYRSAANKWNANTGFTPTVDMPGILVIVDECHQIFPNGTAEWAEIAREGRKLGAAILGASQVVTLDAFGSDQVSDALKSSLISGNGIALRTMSNVQQNVFPGLSVPLDKLPDMPGFGYTVAAGDDGADRTAPFRARWLVDEKTTADVSVPDDVATAEEWFEAVDTLNELDDRSAYAMGPVFTERGAQRDQEREQLASIFDSDELSAMDALFDAEDAVDNDHRAATAAARPGAPAPQDGGGAPPMIPGASTPAPTTPAPAPAATATPVGLKPAEAAVWRALVDGQHRTVDIAGALSVTPRHVQAQLQQLADRGLVDKVGRGEYRPVT